MGNSTANSPQQTTEVNPKENLRRKMALNINTFSPFSMRSAFDDSFFKSSWEDGWMIPSRSQMLQTPFKEFKSMFNEEETKMNEDDAKMEIRIDASEYKPEELKVSVQSGRLLVEGKHEEKKDDGCLCPEELLEELHPSQGGASGPDGLQSLLRGCPRHHHSQDCTCSYK